MDASRPRHTRYDRKTYAALRSLQAQVGLLTRAFEARGATCADHSTRISKVETRIYAAIVLATVLGPPILKHIFHG